MDPSRGAINVRGNYADSNYNSLQVTGTHNFKHGLLINANYTFSKDLSDGDEIFTLSTAQTSYTANLAPGGRRQDYSNSAFDHRHFFSVSYVYQVPGLHSTNHFADLMENVLTRNWTVSGVSQLQSGAYATYNAGGLDLNGDGSAFNDRPIEVNKSADPQSVGIAGDFVGGDSGVYYDTAQLNTTGNLVTVDPSTVHFLVPYFPDNSYLSQEIGRNSYKLPGTTYHNIALEKGFDFRERASLILRAEAQNFVNHNDNNVGDTNVLDAGAGFLSPSRTVSNPISEGFQGRTLVLWAKIQF